MLINALKVIKYLLFQFKQHRECLITSLKGTLEWQILFVMSGHMRVKSILRTQHLATFVTSKVALPNSSPLIRLFLIGNFSIFLPSHHVALIMVVYKVLNIASEENWSLADWTVHGFIARVTVQDMLSNIFGKVSILCT